MVWRKSHIFYSGALQYPAGIKNNTHNAIIKQRESSITIRSRPLLPAGIKYNTRATMDGVGWYNSGCGALQYLAGIKNNTRATNELKSEN